MSAIDPSDAILSFDVAYALYSNAYADALEVLVSSDCGETFTSVYYKAGADLATAPNTTVQFIPANDQWRTETIDLTSFVGNGNVQIKFRNINGYGQSLYLDNINIGGEVLSIGETTLNSFVVYPNPAQYSGAITIQSPITEELNFSLFSIAGKQIAQHTCFSNSKISLREWQLSTGLYWYIIHSKDRIQKGKLLVSDSQR